MSARAKALMAFGPFDSPSYVPELTLADKHFNDIYEDAFRDAMTGRGDFWPLGDPYATPRYDNEQGARILQAVQVAAALIGASDAQRWQCVLRTLRKEADDYAQSVADERTTV